MLNGSTSAWSSHGNASDSRFSELPSPRRTTSAWCGIKFVELIHAGPTGDGFVALALVVIDPDR